METDNYSEIVNAAKRMADAWLEFTQKFIECVCEIADRCREIIGDLMEKEGYQPPRKYRLIKRLSKVTGIPSSELWKKTNIYRIRSHC